MKLDFPKEIAVGTGADYACKYSICTLVTSIEEYEGMVKSFVRGGFTPDQCEYLFINNSKGNKADAFRGYNLFLKAARGEHIILCHQDIVLLSDGIQVLDERIKELDRLDPWWAVLGNAGLIKPNHAAMHITHPAPVGECKCGPLPAKVQSLDENFIVVKNSAQLCVSHDLSGFHLYGTDLCRLAQRLGRTCWAVDFNLLHNSDALIDDTFYELCTKLEKKNRPAGLVETTCTVLSFSDSWFLQKRALFNRIYYARKRGHATRDYREKMMKSLGYWFYALFWLACRIQRPFENLVRHFRKRRQSA